MGEDKTRVTVEIMGVPYKLTGHSNTGHMRKVAELVDEQMKRIAKGFPRLDTPRVAVLAAVNIADDYLRQQEQFEKKKAGLQQGVIEEHKELEHRLEQLESEHKRALDQIATYTRRESDLADEMSRLREEYTKLQAEYNEWIQLVQTDPQ